jgi:hypothetical protein
MSKKRFALVALCSCITFTTNVFSADSVPDYFECSPEKIFLCEADKDKCANIPVINIDGAYSINIDLINKSWSSFEGSEKFSEGTVERFERHEDLVFLHGFQDMRRGEKLPHSWTAVISTKTGQLTITSVANGTGFTLTGHCTISMGGQP